MISNEFIGANYTVAPENLHRNMAIENDCIALEPRGVGLRLSACNIQISDRVVSVQVSVCRPRSSHTSTAIEWKLLEASCKAGIRGYVFTSSPLSIGVRAASPTRLGSTAQEARHRAADRGADRAHVSGAMVRYAAPSWDTTSRWSRTR